MIIKGFIDDWKKIGEKLLSLILIVGKRWDDKL